MARQDAREPRSASGPGSARGMRVWRLKAIQRAAQAVVSVFAVFAARAGKRFVLRRARLCCEPVAALRLVTVRFERRGSVAVVKGRSGAATFRGVATGPSCII